MNVTTWVVTQHWQAIKNMSNLYDVCIDYILYLKLST